MDDREAVKIGELEKNSEAIKVVKPKFNKEIYQIAAVREGVNEMTLREGEEGTMRSFFYQHRKCGGASRRGPPLVDEDGEWENLCYNFVEMNKEINIRKSRWE